MQVPLELCEKRDPKGLYKKARAGQLKGFTGAALAHAHARPRLARRTLINGCVVCACSGTTGVDDPYEEPLSAELVLEAYDAQGNQRSPEVMAAELLEYLEAQRLLEGPS